MESGKQELHSSTLDAATSVLITSPLPGNGLPLSPSVFCPLGSSSITSILPIPGAVLPVQQKQQSPMQGEPLLLVPASALSLSANSNLMLTSPSLISTIHQNSVLFSPYPHQNGSQMPIVLDPAHSLVEADEALRSQQVSQQLIVLPVGGENGSSKPKLDQYVDLKSCYESAQVIANKGQTGDIRIATQINQVNSQSQTAYCKSPNKKLKDKDVKIKDIATTKSHKLTEISSVNVPSCELNTLDLAQIISNIPEGWQVVGFTNLNQLPLGEVISTSTSSSPLSSLLAVTPSAEAKCPLKNEVNPLTNEITPHNQPSLVSVNLNATSQPFSSEVFDKWPANKLTCSLKMDDIPCSDIISIKTESLENTEESITKTTERSDPEHISNGHLDPTEATESHTTFCSTAKETHNLEEPATPTFVGPYSVCENGLFLKDSVKLKSLFTSPHDILPDSKWTVIGVTSIPPLHAINTVATSQADMTTPHLMFNSQELFNAPTETSCASSTTILKVPFCPPTALLANESNRPNTSNIKTSNKASACPTASLVSNDRHMQTSECSQPKPEDFKWTIVGVVGSLLTTSSIMNSCISQGSELLCTSQSLPSPPQPLSITDSKISGQLLRVVSPLTSSTNPLLLSPGSSSGHLSPDSQRKRKFKLQEDVKKSPDIRSSSSKDDPYQNNSSPLSQSQWKIVGVTQLGIPPSAATSPIVPLSQLNPLPPPMSMLVPTIPGPSLSNMTLQTTSMVTQTSETQLSAKFISSLSASPSLFSTPALPFPILNLDGTSCNSKLSLSPTASFLGTTSPSSLKTFVDRQNFNHFIQNQLTACQTPINMLTLNETNQWNIVGVVGDNHVSMLNPRLVNSPSTHEVATEDKSRSEALESPRSSVTSIEDLKSNQDISSSDDRSKIKGAGTNSKTTTVRQSLALKPEDPHCKHFHFKCKDRINKHQQQESTKMKKNTVSNLLRMKRMQQKPCENENSEEGEQNFEEYQEFSDTPYEVPQKKAKTRSLRSYAGNRKIFTRMQNKTADVKLSLRSGTQIPVAPSKSEDEDVDGPKKMMERVTSTVVTARELLNVSKNTEVTIEGHSSSRRRKLKVPRKLVADLDYHPFDSSSDSN